MFRWNFVTVTQDAARQRQEGQVFRCSDVQRRPSAHPTLWRSAVPGPARSALPTRHTGRLAAKQFRPLQLCL